METLRNLSVTQKVVLAFVAGVVVGVGGYYFLVSGAATRGVDKDSTKATSTEELPGSVVLDGSDVTTPSKDVTTHVEPITVPDTNAIAVDTQKAGDRVEVTMVTFSQTGWVAIHEDRDGKLGNVLGAARFEPGIHLGSVELLRPTESGKTYYAVLYADNGDRMFDLKTDAPMQTGGTPIQVTFKVN